MSSLCRSSMLLSVRHAPTLWSTRCTDMAAEILEYSNIAWPNPGMWCQAPLMGFKYNSCGGVGSTSEPADIHGHSPSKPDSRILPNASTQSAPSSAIYNAFASNRAFPVSQWQMQPRDHRWAAFQERYQEPFMSAPSTDTLANALSNDPAWQHRGARSSREDIPMPDYSSSASSRALSSMTGMSYEHSKQPSIAGPIDDEQYNLLLQALTPTKAPTMGTRAPSNTPSAVAGATGATKPSAMSGKQPAKDKSSSARGLALREISQPSTRHVSGSSLQSVSKETTPPKLGNSPSGNIKGRKEGSKEAPPQTPTKNNGQKKVMVEEITVETPKKKMLESAQETETTGMENRENETS